MASGISHMLISQKILSELEESKLRNYLLANLEFIYLGSVSPDLPYLSVLDSSIHKQEKKVADLFHYEDTNQIVLKGLEELKHSNENENIRASKFTFLMGYASHVIVDGIVHPFVRDMVGDYKGNETEHRRLEMGIDVFLYEHFRGSEINYSDFHDNVSLIDDSDYKSDVLAFFNSLIHEVYKGNTDFLKESGDVTVKRIEQWISALVLSLEIAEGSFPWIYRKVLGSQAVSFYNREDIRSQRENFLVLDMPEDAIEKEMNDNFLKQNKKIDFLSDVIPQCEKHVSSFWGEAFEYVFGNRERLDFVAINLDTGRLLEKQSLEEVPHYWRDA